MEPEEEGAGLSMLNALSAMETELGIKADNSVQVNFDDLEKHESEATAETSKKSSSYSGI